MCDRTTQTNPTNQPSLLLVRGGGHRLYSRGFNRRGFLDLRAVSTAEASLIYARFQPPRLR
ncbi:MAG: hypothetical protein EAZ19_29740 [Oscillatoriales cyanobacterium]|nr:MAG: hypothetical protein EAZ28_05660 [Oscillatoriales cyanobacterium]TAG85784.1 MAG: hypothetical protein EAZ19_29740 [Oscillatoriales cyanobacterium]